MSTRLVPLVLLGALLAPAAAASPPLPATPAVHLVSAAGQGPAAQSEHVRTGVSHFERAFYEFTPRKRDREAAVEFDLAVAAFERELSVRPSSRAAHAYLGRIYAIRREFRKAATHYDRVMDLDPLDVDACVLSALAYIENGQLAEAGTRLAIARGRTSDPAVLKRLSEYASRLRPGHPWRGCRAAQPCGAERGTPRGSRLRPLRRPSR